MKKIKRYLVASCVLIGIFIIIFLCVHFLSKGYTNKYTVGKYEVKEIYTKSEQDEHDNYYIEISANNVIYNYQFYKIKDDNKIVKDIIYYDGEYKCLLPILSDDIKVDFLCYKDSSYYNYVDIKGKDAKLDRYIKKLGDKYDANLFLDKNYEEPKKNKIAYYEDSVPKEYIVTMTSLKGITSIIDGKIKNYDIFEKDVYTRELSTFHKNYYITANYDQKQKFSEIYIVNVITGEKKKIKTPEYISFDSYIQGIVDNSLYIYDINNEAQYEVNINNGEVTIVGDSNKGIKYYNGSWSHISSVKANNILLFKNKKLKKSNSYYTYNTGNKLSGFFYYYFNVDDKYEVYRSHTQNKKLKKHLFDVDDYTQVVYLDEYIFYKDKNKIKLYSDYTGIKTIINYSELEYNENINFSVYKIN